MAKKFNKKCDAGAKILFYLLSESTAFLMFTLYFKLPYQSVFLSAGDGGSFVYPFCPTLYRLLPVPCFFVGLSGLEYTKSYLLVLFLSQTFLFGVTYNDSGRSLTQQGPWYKQNIIFPALALFQMTGENNR